MTAMIWWAIGFALVVAEMTTGTFYLLILGASALVAGVLAWLGLGLEVQSLSAILIATLGCFGVSFYRSSRPKTVNATQAIDVGRKVELLSRSQGELRVRYRGTEWQAELAAECASEHVPEVLYIIEVRNNILIVGPDAPV